MPVAIATSTIVAQAFRLMEMRPVSSFGDDSEQARAAAEQYDTALGLCLEAADWSFASAILSLPPVASSGPEDPRLPYRFLLPGSALVLREVLTEDATWRLDRDALRASVPGPLLLRVTERVEDESRLPATFRTAVALQLAVLLAPLYVEVQSKQEALAGRLQDAMRAAMRTDARTASAGAWAGAEAGDWAAEARL